MAAIVSILALAAQGGGIGQVSAWDILRQAGRFNSAPVGPSNGMAKASPYGTPQRPNEYANGVGMGLMDATTLKWVDDFVCEVWMDTGSGMEWCFFRKSVSSRHSGSGFAERVIDIDNVDTSSLADYSYNATEHCTLAVYQAFDQSGLVWGNSEKRVIAYGQDDGLLSVCSFDWDATADDWGTLPVMVDSFAYDGFGNLVLAVYSSPMMGYTDTTRYAYVDNLVVGSITVNSDGDSLRVSTTYPDPQTQIDVSTVLRWDTTSWVKSDSSVSEYDADGQQTIHSSFWWNAENAQFEKYYRLTMFRSQPNQIDQFVLETGDETGGWVNLYRGTYAYSGPDPVRRDATLAHRPATAARVQGELIVVDAGEVLGLSFSIQDALGRRLFSREILGRTHWRAACRGIYIITVTQNGRVCQERLPVR